MRIQYYRIFIAKTKQLSLFDDAQAEVSKSDLIYEVFNVRQPFYFTAGSQRLAYVTQKDAGTYILGTLAKAAHVNVQKSPEEGFITESIESWPHVPIIINTSSDPSTGQSIVVGFNRSIFKNPLYQLRILTKELSKGVEARGYELAVNTISDKDDFWKNIKQNQGFIKSLTFSFAAPNLFGTEDSLNDELRDARDSFGMTNTEVKIENSSSELSIPEGNQFVDQSLRYVADGGGSYKIKLKNKRVIQSKELTKSSVIEDIELEIASQDRSTLEQFCDKLFLWLGRSE